MARTRPPLAAPGSPHIVNRDEAIQLLQNLQTYLGRLTGVGKHKVQITKLQQEIQGLINNLENQDLTTESQRSHFRQKLNSVLEYPLVKNASNQSVRLLEIQMLPANQQRKRMIAEVAAGFKRIEKDLKAKGRDVKEIKKLREQIKNYSHSELDAAGIRQLYASLNRYLENPKEQKIFQGFLQQLEIDYIDAVKGKLVILNAIVGENKTNPTSFIDATKKIGDRIIELLSVKEGGRTPAEHIELRANVRDLLIALKHTNLKVSIPSRHIQELEILATSLTQASPANQVLPAVNPIIMKAAEVKPAEAARASLPRTPLYADAKHTAAVSTVDRKTPSTPARPAPPFGSPPARQQYDRKGYTVAAQEQLQQGQVLSQFQNFLGNAPRITSSAVGRSWMPEEKNEDKWVCRITFNTEADRDAAFSKCHELLSRQEGVTLRGMKNAVPPMMEIVVPMQNNKGFRECFEELIAQGMALQQESKAQMQETVTPSARS